MSGPHRARHSGHRAWLLALVLGWAACLTSCKSRTDAPAGPRATRVLFIGNSYTYYNNLPHVLEALAASASPSERVETRMVTVGGARLKNHWDDDDAVDALGEGGWNHVVLQEQSTLGTLIVDGRHEINDPERIYFPYARRFHSEVLRRGARPVLALTWSRRHAPEAQVRLNHAILGLGRELGATVAPMGLAWQQVREQHPDIPLYVDDGSHPAPAGTYLAACTLYATLFGRSPEGLTATVRGVPTPDGKPVGDETTLISIPEPTARVLQRAAWQAVETLRTQGANLVKAPPPRTLPTLPTGATMRWEALPGTWSGELRLYPEEWGRAPAKMHLELSSDGDDYEGELRVTFTDGSKEGPFDVEAERSPSGILRFTTPYIEGAPGEVRFEAVMTPDGKLVGTAAYEEPKSLDRAFGSWRLEPAR
ncbi:SGNH/GDSL hydrolase family protein [Pyxidicoccus fallax]|uniref:SGNH/GDSL hydrolase family protein n=1 Tax=Pyxidicoccus fallax TaxID=394095 RepID=A0A848L8X7_9BACT|nr:SGNH/GDSL hydrolase family protein [Pyxidicoccus fallax]NMO15279.1 SGNH/GDSL hydrolase family protein [Pyxidicoccus fallax]NPC77608.1 SGNH/GDSL hydrolase family protein [Pyxidicoccus fallax]